MSKSVLMVAAENDALPGAKVGGVGDVLRDLPCAMSRLGAEVETAIPSHGFLSRLDGLETVGQGRVSFSDRTIPYEVLMRRAAGGSSSPSHIIIHSEEFSVAGESVYFHDRDGRPFASDANKFALFSLCLLDALSRELIRVPDVLHCHDWHTGFLFMLIAMDSRFESLRSIRTVFTVHNLAMQGIRPIEADTSSFQTWFPAIAKLPPQFIDPRYEDCINPMRAGIVSADAVHTVSPTYAREILVPSRHRAGVYGGEGLEKDLNVRFDEGNLSGVLNGCEYDGIMSTPIPRKALDSLLHECVSRWLEEAAEAPATHALAHKRLSGLNGKYQDGFIVASVGRLTEQKVRLLTVPLDDGRSALDHILDCLGPCDVLIMLGSGAEELEHFFAEVSERREQFIFLNGYSSDVSEALYQAGDLFLMPSSFEPCGISQMLAMRAGQPCLVNAVGGLRDTVNHLVSGFVFSGDTLSNQAHAMVAGLREARALWENVPEEYQKIRDSAAAQRFTWDATAEYLLNVLYA